MTAFWHEGPPAPCGCPPCRRLKDSLRWNARIAQVKMTGGPTQPGDEGWASNAQSCGRA
jgi:hypothetical protein